MKEKKKQQQQLKITTSDTLIQIASVWKRNYVAIELVLFIHNFLKFWYKTKENVSPLWMMKDYTPPENKYLHPLVSMDSLLKSSGGSPPPPPGGGGGTAGVRP